MKYQTLGNMLDKLHIRQSKGYLLSLERCMSKARPLLNDLPLTRLDNLNLVQKKSGVALKKRFFVKVFFPGFLFFLTSNAAQGLKISENSSSHLIHFQCFCLKPFFLLLKIFQKKF